MIRHNIRKAETNFQAFLAIDGLGEYLFHQTERKENWLSDNSDMKIMKDMYAHGLHKKRISDF
jgi:hypothetical protein